jgi:hypothetical protein
MLPRQRPGEAAGKHTGSLARSCSGGSWPPEYEVAGLAGKRMGGLACGPLSGSVSRRAIWTAASPQHPRLHLAAALALNGSDVRHRQLGAGMPED